MMNRCIHVILFLFSTYLTYSQLSKKITFENYVTFQQEDDLLKQKGFFQSDIFNGTINADFWMSETKKCIRSEQKENYIELNWNKDQDDCDWVGLGFGWENWMGKDLSLINELASIEFIVRTKNGSTNNLPFAFGLEDYSGNQCWLGYQKKFLSQKVIDTNWTSVLIPLNQFPATENSFSFNNVKQFIVQCFASGDLQIKSIRIVPNLALNKQEVKLKQFQKNTFNNSTSDNQIGYYSLDSLFFNFSLNDSLSTIDSAIVYLAFASNPNASINRTSLLLSDKISMLKWVTGFPNDVSGLKLKLKNNKVIVQVSSIWLDRNLLKGEEIYGNILVSIYKKNKLEFNYTLLGNTQENAIKNPSNWIKLILD